MPDPRTAVVHVVALVGSGGQFGGPASVALNLTAELASRGRDVRLIALRGGRVERFTGIPPRSWRLFTARRFVPGTGMLGLFNVRLLAALWRSLRPGAVAHVHAGRDLVSLAALVVAWIRRAPVIAQTHGMVLPRDSRVSRLFDSMFLPLLRRSAVVLYLTDQERVDLTQLLGTTRLAPITNGVEVPERASPQPRDDSGLVRVVFASRLHPVKGVSTFTGAARHLVSIGSPAEFVVYGADQGELANVLDMSASPDLGGRLRYGGALDHRSTLGALRDADIFVLPSHVDWIPMALLEAMAAGVATVSSTTSGLAPSIQAADAGLVVPPDVDSVARAVGLLVADPPLRARLGQRARDLVDQSYSIASITDDLEALYREIDPEPA